jgi:hypothetical protein
MEAIIIKNTGYFVIASFQKRETGILYSVFRSGELNQNSIFLKHGSWNYLRKHEKQRDFYNVY